MSSASLRDHTAACRASWIISDDKGAQRALTSALLSLLRFYRTLATTGRFHYPAPFSPHHTTAILTATNENQHRREPNHLHQARRQSKIAFPSVLNRTNKRSNPIQSAPGITNVKTSPQRSQHTPSLPVPETREDRTYYMANIARKT